jgi:FdhD protein
MDEGSVRREVVWAGPEGARRGEDFVVVEEPLEIRIGKVSVVVTMRTPGHDAELAAGFLLGEGVVSSGAEIEELSHCDDPGRPESRGNILVARLAPSATVDLDRLRRNFYATSSCGICGKASIEQVRQRCRPARAQGPRQPVEASVLGGLPDRLLAAQGVFSRTGGLHAAGLFDSRGNLLCAREDVGRHNAVDKAVGWMVLQGRPEGEAAILLVSGRASFEIVQKALAAGIGVVAAVSAASSLAVDLARESGMTLVGFLRAGRWVVYTGEEGIGSVPV